MRKKNILKLLVLLVALMLGMNKISALNYYNVEFYPNNGENVVTKVVEENALVTPLNPEPTKEGYKFENWILVSNNEIYDFSTNVTSNIQLKASWELITEEETTLNPNTGNTSYIIFVTSLMLLSLTLVIYNIKKRSV